MFLSLLLQAVQADAKATKELLDRGYGKVAVVEGGSNPIERTFTLKIDNSLPACVEHV